MGFISAFSYIPYLSRVICAIGIYRRLQDVDILATEIGQILIEATEPYQKSSLDFEELKGALTDVIRAFEKAF